MKKRGVHACASNFPFDSLESLHTGAWPGKSAYGSLASQNMHMGAHACKILFWGYQALPVGTGVP